MSDCCGVDDVSFVKLTPDVVEAEISQGDTLRVRFLVKDQTPAKATLDISGCAISAEMRSRKTGTKTALVVTISSTSSTATEHGTATAADETTLALEPGGYDLGIRVTDPAGDARTFARVFVRIVRSTAAA